MVGGRAPAEQAVPCVGRAPGVSGVSGENGQSGVTTRFSVANVIVSGLQSVLVAISSVVVAAVLVYDVNRAIVPRILGEQGWRRWRAAGTLTALAAASFLHRGVGPLWLKRTGITAVVLACAVVLRCSIPLKRLVERSVQSRRGG